MKTITKGYLFWKKKYCTYCEHSPDEKCPYCKLGFWYNATLLNYYKFWLRLKK